MNLPEIPKFIKEKLLLEKKQKNDMSTQDRVIYLSMIISILVSMMNFREGNTITSYIFCFLGLFIYMGKYFFDYYNEVKKAYLIMENLVNSKINDKTITEENREVYLSMKEEYNSYWEYNKKTFNLLSIFGLLSFIGGLIPYKLGYGSDISRIIASPFILGVLYSMFILIQNTRKYLVIKTIKRGV